jgi:hypothetical protein
VVFAFNDFCEVGWPNDPFKVSQERRFVLTLGFACQELGIANMSEKLLPPTQDIVMGDRTVFG